MLEQFTHTVSVCWATIERVAEVKHCVGVSVCVCVCMKCVILKVLSMTERADLCECMLILKGVCEYFWRWVNDYVLRISLCIW